MDESPQPTRLRMVELPAHDPGRGGGRRDDARAARAPEPPADRARRPGRRHAARHRLRAPAGRRPRARPRRARRDGRGRADRRARGPAADLRRARGHRARPSAARLLRAIEQRPERTCSPRRRAPRRSRWASAPCCWSRPPALVRRAHARPGPTSPARPSTGDVAAKFRLSMTQIVEASEVARLSATARGAERADAGRPRPRRPPGLLLAARRARRPPPARLQVGGPRRARPSRREHAAVDQRLPAPPRPRAVSDWGYEKTVSRTQGLKVLFAGESGTGKTMGAQVHRRRARPGDLPRGPRHHGVASTSVRPRRTSTASSAPPRAPTRSCSSTRPTPCSASAPRSATRHDRYANIEVAYLLQKMEGYPGAVILATNFRRNIDDAFVRRLDFVIDFPFPEPEDRKRIWDKVLPDEAPRADDIDLDFLSREVQALRRRDPQLLAVRRLPGRRRRLPRSRCATSCARSRRSTASRAG